MPKAKVDPTEANLTPAQLQALVNGRWPGAMKMGSDPSLAIERLPTGVLSVDWIMRGGFARGRSVELFGGEHIGKTALALRLIAQTQADGGTCAYIDNEHTFDPAFATHVGVDVESLMLHEQVHGNRVVDFMQVMLLNEVDVIVMDSIAALTPKIEQESDMEVGSMGMEQAKLMSKGLRKLTSANKRTALVFINQVRENPMAMFGDKRITSGGRSMAFYASTRLEFVKTETLKKSGTEVDTKTSKEKATTKSVYGHRALIKTKKDKTGAMPTGTQTTFVFDYELGDIDPVEDLVYVGREAGLVHNSGDSFWVQDYEDERKANRKSFITWLRKQADLQEVLEEEIRAMMVTA